MATRLLAKPVSAVLTESRVTDALTFLSSTDEQLAELKASVARSEYLAKLQESMGYRAATGNVDERWAEAMMLPEARKARDAQFAAVVAYEKLRARREREILIVDLWRTIEASRRKGNP